MGRPSPRLHGSFIALMRWLGLQGGQPV
jgi:hypothetical protein